MPESKHRKDRKPPPAQRARPKKEIAKNPSPSWYGAVILALMGTGVVLVLLNYFLPNIFSRWGLFAGLGAFGIGFILTMYYK